MTQEELRRVLVYNPETGVFTWRVRVSQRVLAGMPAGKKHYAGYWHIKIKGDMYSAHRLAWLYVYGNFPDGYVDHINGVRDDNRLSNLRAATRTQNAANSKLRPNLTGQRGVSVQKSGRYQAATRFNNKFVSAGTYDSPEEAGAAAAAKRRELHGEFAR